MQGLAGQSAKKGQRSLTATESAKRGVGMNFRGARSEDRGNHRFVAEGEFEQWGLPSVGEK